MKLIGVVLKHQSRDAQEAFRKLKDHLEVKDLEYVLIHSRRGDLSDEVKDRIPRCDLAVAFGGDGTLLFTARLFSRYNVPIVGINLGGLGFITEFRESEAVECVQCFLERRHSFEERMMIDVFCMSGGRIRSQDTGLNDLVINSGGISRLIELELSTDHTLIGTYRSDGIIVSTPTGSTAYSLAAGGPILDPLTDAFVISPICPHSLGARPLVVPSGRSIHIRVLPADRPVTATIDGQVAHELGQGDQVTVVRSGQVTRLVSTGSRSYYDIVREKLYWKG
ncbi:MAG: NAD(+)/NADH kinase [Spirochaetota bacterium]